MQAYRISVNLKLGLVVAAVAIAVASLAYTHRLVERLGEREEFIIRLWAIAQERIAESSLHINPHLEDFQQIEELLRRAELPSQERRRLLRSLDWARSMPPAGELTLASEILLQGHFGVPAIIMDSTVGGPVAWHNVGLPPSTRSLSAEDSIEVTQKLFDRAASMRRVHQPISIDIRATAAEGEARLRQYVFYDESGMIKELRIFPYLQLIFVALFVLVGYVGFSYVRRSEQRSLWVGMAKEAAHQLGTPISSLMGWTELLRSEDLDERLRAEAVEDMDADIRRLQRVASRFSDIGSVPRLKEEDIGMLIHETVEYMQKRIPRHAGKVELDVEVEPGLLAPTNSELFEWVIENLLKNALDAMEGRSGRIGIRGRQQGDRVVIDVEDSGKGIERREFKNVFRPGFSTKKRGWGLGLSLAKRIVDDYHGGQLKLLHSRVGSGTTFRIELPAGSRQDSG